MSSKGFGKDVKSPKGGLEKHIVKKSGGKGQSKDWYRREVLEYLYENMTDEVLPNKMYFFEYDPKLKDKLPRYDTYPLVYSFDRAKDNFIGANLHYLPDKVRPLFAKSILNKTARIPEETIHRYIFKNADNFFFEVKDEDWEFIASLPIEKFIEN
jgi:hypothetical protein